MKIYVVTHTEYPMYEGQLTHFTVIGAFKDKDKANECANHWNGDVEDVELE